jgi:type VI secretion system ImpJ/VasE family protein
MRLGQPFGWGIRTLRIREEGLAAHTFEVLQCEIVTRDGITLYAGSEIAQPNARLNPRSFEGLIDPMGKPLSVYLGLPRYQAGQSNLSSEEGSAAQGIPTRYHLTGEPRPDLFEREAPEADIGFIEYNLALLFDRENTFASASQGFELIKIAELLPLATGVGARLSKQYIPPCMAVSSSTVLLGRLKAVRDLLTSKGQEFAVLKRQRGLRATASTLQDTLRLVMLQTLDRYIPLFHHVLELGHLHPEPAYALLRQLVGELSVFSEEVDVLGAIATEQESTQGLPPYDHEDLWPRFDLAIARIQELVSTMTTGPEAGIRLTFEGEYFQAVLSPPVFEGERTRYYLMIDSGMSGPELSSLLQRTGKICAKEDMPRLRQSALFGLKIDYLPVPPEELPQRSSRYSYFGIDIQSPHWKRIRDAGNIAVLCQLDPSETSMKLLVVRED